MAPLAVPTKPISPKSKNRKNDEKNGIFKFYTKRGMYFTPAIQRVTQMRTHTRIRTDTAVPVATKTERMMVNLLYFAATRNIMVKLKAGEMKMNEWQPGRQAG